MPPVTQTEFVFSDLAPPAAVRMDSAVSPCAAPVEFPAFALSEETTPAEILGWWDSIVEKIELAWQAGEKRAAPLTEELRGLKGKRDGASRRLAASLRARICDVMTAAKAVHGRGYALFETTIADFAPRLTKLIVDQGVVSDDDYETEVDDFWQCLQRPDIEHNSKMTLREIVKFFWRDCVPA